MVLYQDIADENRFRTSLTVSAARLPRALERAASHEPQAGVHREGQRDGGEHLFALQGVRHLPADRPQVAWRFRAQGYTGLVEQSRRPLSSPLTTGEDIVVRVLELRDQHQTWGPDKIARVLPRSLGEDAPSKAP